jgi:hypothetical protein
MASLSTWLTKRMIEASSAAASRLLSSRPDFIDDLEGLLLVEGADGVGADAEALLHLALDPGSTSSKPV